MSYAKDFVARATARSSAAAGARVISLDEMRHEQAAGAPRWQLDDLTGRLTELSSFGPSAAYAATTALVLEAQRRGEPVAWIRMAGLSFFPPDLDDSGVDLAALIVVRVRDATTMARAADTLLRSGAFGLVVLALGANTLTMGAQSRLVGLAQRHDAVLVALTDKPRDTPSLSSLVSVRAEAIRERTATGFRINLQAIKDKRRGPGWRQLLDVIAIAGMV